MKCKTLIITALSLVGAAALPTRAQWSLEGSLFQNNSYYRGWVNPYDNTMTRTRMPGMNPFLYGGGGGVPPSVYGARIIKSGRATTKFRTRPFPIGQYMSGAWSGNGDAALRKRYYAEYLAQTALWRQEAKARGAQFGDYAHMQALALVTCAEAYNGKRISNAGFKYRVAKYRRLYLTSAAFQGYDLRRKQETYESTMLSASYALYLRRTGNIEKAREVATKWLDEDWETDHPGVPDAQDAVASLSRFATPTVAKAPVRRIAPANKPTASVRATPQTPAPQMTLVQARQMTLFSPVAPSLVPAMLSAQSGDEQNRRAFEQLLAAGRERINGIFATPSGKQSVADALTFAILTFYTASKTTSGNVSEAGFTEKNLAGLNEQITMMLARNPKFRAQNATQKQQMAETFILMATFVGAMNAQADKSGDARMSAHVRELASQSMQKLTGVPMSKVRLTGDGLRFG